MPFSNDGNSIDFRSGYNFERPPDSVLACMRVSFFYVYVSILLFSFCRTATSHDVSSIPESPKVIRLCLSSKSRHTGSQSCRGIPSRCATKTEPRRGVPQSGDAPGNISRSVAECSHPVIAASVRATPDNGRRSFPRISAPCTPSSIGV